MKTAKASTLPSASCSLDPTSAHPLKRIGKGIGKGTGVLLALCLLLCGQNDTKALAAEIVAQIDGEIVTEHDVAKRSVLLQKRLVKALPSLRQGKEDRKAFALDLLLLRALQQRHLLEERALPVADSAVKERLSLVRGALKAGKTKDKAERRFREELARLELTWEGYVGRVAEFNSPVTPEDALAERARLRTNAAEPRYSLEEVFLPRLEAGERTRRTADALYRSLKGGRSFARLKAILPAPYAHEGLATQLLYKSDLPPAVLDALERRRIGPGGIVPPVTSPYGVHLYRVVRQRDYKTETRYSFVQTFFLQSRFEASQAAALADPEFCKAPQDASLSLAYYDLQTFDDVPEVDLNPDLKQSLSTMSLGETIGPFAYAQGLLILVTLCDRQKVAERGDSFAELTSGLRLKRARALSLRLVESLRTQANIEKQAGKTLSSLPVK